MKPVEDGESGVSHPAAPKAHAGWEDRMIEVLDGRGRVEDAAGLERHLERCSACRAAYDEYRHLFSELRPEDASTLPREFWDELAVSIKRRLNDPREEAEPRLDDGVGSSRVHGRNGLAGGLVAAGVAVLVLVGLYLELPRTTGAPRAFIESEPQDGGLVEREPFARSAPANDLTLEVANGPPPAAGSLDPLAALADAELALGGLTPGEADELLRVLEARK